MKPDDAPTMTCDWCQKVFPADARCCLEGGIAMEHDADPAEDWKSDRSSPVNLEDLSPGQRASMKQQLGLTDAELDQLLICGKVEGLGTIVCLECQQKGLEETAS